MAGMGTGSTISGISKYLKEKNPEIKIVGIDIYGSLLHDAWKDSRLSDEPALTTYKVEGIGEDLIPGTMDLGLIDEVVQVDDRESFLMTRRLVREEGIFCRGLLAAAFRTGTRPADGSIAVVLLPDSGDHYLSKVFDDNWMRENGFLLSEPDRDTVQSVIEQHPAVELVTARPEDRLVEVVDLMKTHDISQIPVVDQASMLIGIVTEMDLLDHLMHTDHLHDPAETIAPMASPNVYSAPPDTSIEDILPVFERGRVGLPVRLYS